MNTMCINTHIKINGFNGSNVAVQTLVQGQGNNKHTFVLLPHHIGWKQACSKYDDCNGFRDKRSDNNILLVLIGLSLCVSLLLFYHLPLLFLVAFLRIRIRTNMCPVCKVEASVCIHKEPKTTKSMF